jgi:hypothetical protein
VGIRHVSSQRSLAWLRRSDAPEAGGPSNFHIKFVAYLGELVITTHSRRVVLTAMSTLDSEQLGPFSRLESPKNGIASDSLSDSDPRAVTKPAESERAEVTLTTSRRELWAFYLYYVVRSLRLFRLIVRFEPTSS